MWEVFVTSLCQRGASISPLAFVLRYWLSLPDEFHLLPRRCDSVEDTLAASMLASMYKKSMINIWYCLSYIIIRSEWQLGDMGHMTFGHGFISANKKLIYYFPSLCYMQSRTVWYVSEVEILEIKSVEEDHIAEKPENMDSSWHRKWSPTFSEC